MNMKGRESPGLGIGTWVLPSMSIPARIRESASMAWMVLAPPAEWPPMAMRDGSISLAPRHLPIRHLGWRPVSSSNTNETSAARLCMELVKPGDSTIRRCRRPAGRASTTAFVRTVLSTSSGLLAMFWRSR
jgi:hypothetical protein